MAKTPTAPEWVELFDLLKRLERPSPLHVRELAEVERQQAIDRICEILRSGALQGYLNERGTTREPALTLAAEAGLHRVVEALLEAGASANVSPREHLFPLYLAAFHGDREIVETLLAAGADVHRKTKNGSTALIAAAESGDPSVVRVLLGAGADPRTKTSGGATALTNARGPSRDEILALLADAARALDRAEKTKGKAVASEEGCIRCTGKGRDDARQRRGARDFLDHVNRGQPEWTLVAAQADVESVAAILAELREATVWEKDAALRPVSASRRFAFAVRLHGHDWTVAPLSIGWARLEDLQTASRDARALSERLGVRALSFFGEDAGGTIGMELFERGESIELVEWGAGSSNWNVIDRALTDLGLYVFPCAFDSDGRNARLELEGIPLEDIERADYLGFTR